MQGASQKSWIMCCLMFLLVSDELSKVNASVAMSATAETTASAVQQLGSHIAHGKNKIESKPIFKNFHKKTFSSSPHGTASDVPRSGNNEIGADDGDEPVGANFVPPMGTVGAIGADENDPGKGSVDASSNFRDSMEFLVKHKSKSIGGWIMSFFSPSEINSRCMLETKYLDTIMLMATIALATTQSMLPTNYTQRFVLSGVYAFMSLVGVFWFIRCNNAFILEKSTPRVAFFVVKMLLSISINVIAMHSLHQQGLAFGSVTLAMLAIMFLAVFVRFSASAS
jgi:hypothetical protein